MDADERLAAAISSKTGDNRGIVWGSAGTMLAALCLDQRDGEATWRNLFRQQADVLWRQWEFSADCGCHLWTSDLYGVVERWLGALHGYAANANEIKTRQQSVRRGPAAHHPPKCPQRKQRHVAEVNQGGNAEVAQTSDRTAHGLGV